MDNINVSESALNAAIKLLNEMLDLINDTTAKHEKFLIADMRELDEVFRKEIFQFINDMGTFVKKINDFVDENVKALNARLAILSNYSSYQYTKNIFG